MARRAPAAVIGVTCTLLSIAACRDENDRASGSDAVTTTAGLASSTIVPTTVAPTAVAPTTVAPTTVAPTTVAPTTAAPPAAPPTTVVPPRPAWLGQQPLPLRPDGYGEVQPTPPELVDRRLPTPQGLPPPPDDAFVASVSEVPADVLARSTWHPGCPVGPDELRYVNVAFWGFDGQPHTGELLVHQDAADDFVEVFGRLHEARFPIEEMRVVRADELEAPPTGDGNNTSSFSCRNAVLRDSWSMHASGLAVDINPFHNPYVRGDLVLPELASSYVDRANHRPGMIQPGDVVVEAFAAIGWGWGGDFNGLRDDMHFSVNGR